MKKQVVNLPGTGAAVPLSQVVIAGGLAFASGQVGRDLTTRQAASGVEAQTARCIENARLVLEAAGTSLDNVVKTTVFLKHTADFAAMNKVYQSYFPVDPPARSTVQANLMSDELLVEIELIATMPGSAER